MASLTFFFFHHLAFTVLSLASPVLFFLDVLVVTVSIETNYSYHVYSFLFNPSISSFKSSILPFIFPTVASRLAIFSSLQEYERRRRRREEEDDDYDDDDRPRRRRRDDDDEDMDFTRPENRYDRYDRYDDEPEMRRGRRRRRM